MIPTWAAARTVVPQRTGETHAALPFMAGGEQHGVYGVGRGAPKGEPSSRFAHAGRQALRTRTKDA